MATNCTAYTEYPAQMSSDTATSRGIKLGNSREQVIAAYGEPRNEVVYKSKAFSPAADIILPFPPGFYLSAAGFCPLSNK